MKQADDAFVGWLIALGAIIAVAAFASPMTAAVFACGMVTGFILSYG